LGALETDEFYGVRAEAARALATLGRQQDPVTQRRVRDSLVLQGQAEQSNPHPGSQRVLAEIDRILDLI